MTLYLALFLIVFVLGALGAPGAFSVRVDDFMARDVTACINGLFISLVFLSHAKGYVPEELLGPLDNGFLKTISYLGQLVVTTFLFYSGFGMMESIKHKEGYIRALPSRRIMPFLLDVWIALAVYLVIMPFRGAHTDIDTVLLSMVGWKSLGNSNWYIFAIICMWVATYVAFRIFPKASQRVWGVVLVTAFALLYAWVLKHEEVGSWFYNTIVCYPAGMVLSLVVEWVRRLDLGTSRKMLVWVILLVLTMVGFVFLHRLRGKHLVWYFLMTLVFCVIVVLLQMRLRFVSKLFLLAGKHLFYFYIYQRVPMLLLKPLATWGTLPFVTTCLVVGVPFCLAMAHFHATAKRIILS